jgi:hypothetical protein
MSGWAGYAKTTKANPLLTYEEDWLSMSHALLPPTLITVCDESNDGEISNIGQDFTV